MKIFAGPLKNGYLTILVALLLPVLGVGVASADMNVGDTVMLKVPDLAEFPLPIEEHQFTCRAVTEHAYWLVQDTCSVEGSGPGVLGTIVWGNLFLQEELDTMTADFEGGTVDVYGTATGILGNPVDTDGDPKIWIVLCTLNDKYQDHDLELMAYVEPADVDGSGTFNSHDIFYINVHTRTQSTYFLPAARQLRRWYIPNGLGMLIRTTVKPTEEQWLIRGLGAVCHFPCYGITSSSPGGYGLEYNLNKFQEQSQLKLTFYAAGGSYWNFGKSRAQAFLWFNYLLQREGDGVLETIAQSDTTGMFNIAQAIDPSVADSVAIQTNVVPIYYDWLICNITNAYRDDMSGGIYTYEIFSDTTYDFTHMNKVAAFDRIYDTYPIPMLLSVIGLEEPVWMPEYDWFQGDYSGNSTVYFNGAYADATTGSGSPIDGKWVAFVVSLDTVNEEIVSIEEVTLNDLYNGSFDIAGDNAVLVVTGNNEGGAANLRNILSQDSDVPTVLMAVHQNAVNDQYLTLYATPFDSVPEGFDWCGPLFTASTADTTNAFDMSLFYNTLWDCRFTAWEGGDYTLNVAGYDSSGFAISNSTNISVGIMSTGNLALNLDGVHLEVAAGAEAPGAMISLCESSILSLSMNTQVRLEDIEEAMTGIYAGPVSIPEVNATLSFPAESNRGAVYRYTANGWTQLDSYYQNGRMYAPVSDGGNYAYGDAPGVRSPEIPAEFQFGGTYPNPFSAEAAISFSLPSAGRVSVTIYDMSGRAVRTLTNTEMQAAEHTLMWDGLDETGNAVGAGVYFCRLQACGETVTQKMLRIE